MGHLEHAGLRLVLVRSCGTSGQVKFKMMSWPTNGTNPMSSHHPDLPLSWRRRTVRARLTTARQNAAVKRMVRAIGRPRLPLGRLAAV
jgi:hypothetical protein